MIYKFLRRIEFLPVMVTQCLFWWKTEKTKKIRQINKRHKKPTRTAEISASGLKMSPIISFLLLMATIGPLSAFANDIEITPPQVVIANGTNLSVESTVLHCKSSEQHQYCEWTSPDSLKCAPKNCPLEGVTVASDYQTCSVTINHDIHSDYGNHAGDWSCDLFFIRSKTPERNASTHLYIVDLSEVIFFAYMDHTKISTKLAILLMAV